MSEVIDLDFKNKLKIEDETGSDFSEDDEPYFEECRINIVQKRCKKIILILNLHKLLMI